MVSIGFVLVVPRKSHVMYLGKVLLLEKTLSNHAQILMV
jgi:hypothetical protein